MCYIDYVYRHWDPGTVRVSPVGAVEVTRTDLGVMLHAGPGAPGVGIPRRGWAVFVAAVRGGEFDATLDNNDALRTGDVEPLATDAVEVRRTGGGVFLHVLPASIVHIPRKEWWDFIAGVHGGEFDDTLPEVECGPPPDTAGSPVVIRRRPGPGGRGPDTRGDAAGVGTDRAGCPPVALLGIEVWEGTVTYIEENFFGAALLLLSGDDDDPVRFDAEFDVADVSNDDRSLLVPGAPFYMTVLRERRRDGRVDRRVGIRFRRLPKWSKSDVESARRRAAKRRRALGFEDDDADADADGR